MESMNCVHTFALMASDRGRRWTNALGEPPQISAKRAWSGAKYFSHSPASRRQRCFHLRSLRTLRVQNAPSGAAARLVEHWRPRQQCRASCAAHGGHPNAIWFASGMRAHSARSGMLPAGTPALHKRASKKSPAPLLLFTLALALALALNPLGGARGKISSRFRLFRHPL